MAPLHIVALGSSFAAGPGLPPYVDKAARRSSNNYAHILATRLSARLRDLSVSGATLNNILNEAQVVSGSRFEPQLHSLPADADIVTLTAGGNDLAFIGSLFTDSIRAYPLGRLLISPTPQSEMDAEKLSTRFVAVIDQIRERAPRARILLVEYLTILSPSTRVGHDVAFDQAAMDRHVEVAQVLNAAYRLAALARPSVSLVSVADISRDHGLGSDEPWVDPLSLYGLVMGRPVFHPNRAGMQAVADAIYEVLKSWMCNL